MLDYKVDPTIIVQSLYVFACSDQVFISRLERIRAKGIKDIKLTVMKYTEDQFEEYIDPFRTFCIGSTNNMPYRSLKQLSLKNLHKIMVDDDMPKVYKDRTVVVDALRKMLSCDDEEAVSIYYNYLSYSDQLQDAKHCIDYLMERGIGMEFITKYPFLIAHLPGNLVVYLSI